MAKWLFTSESVTEGHPDKISDNISDAVLDAMLEQDPESRVACETFCTTGIVTVMGEITTKAKVDIAKIALRLFVILATIPPKRALMATPAALWLLLTSNPLILLLVLINP